jgi:protein TonB
MENTFNIFDTNAKKLKIFLVVSLVLHLCVSVTQMDGVNILDLMEKKEEKQISIKLITPSQAKQIVQSLNSQKRKKIKEAKFLGAKDNVFDRETKNRNVGTFKDAALGQRNATQNKKKQVQKSELEKKLKKITFSDLAIKPTEKIEVKKNKKVAQTNSAKRGLRSGKKTGRSLGQSNDYLEDIPLGDFTKLNTQEYEFYGFYHRIREKLEQFWGNNIKEEADKIFKQGRSIASENNLVTGLKIKINGKGEIVDIVLKSTSGLKELDDAAIKSFNQAGPFPNPPKGMLKADGKAIIEWGFVVNT